MNPYKKANPPPSKPGRTQPAPQRKNQIQCAKAGGPPKAPSPYRPQPTPKCLQAKSAVGHQPPVAQAKKRPQAPPVYRPQPAQKPLQAKAAVRPSPTPPPAATRPRPVAPPVYRPEAKAVAQPKANGGAPARGTTSVRPPHAPKAAPAPAPQRPAGVVQRMQACPKPFPRAGAGVIQRQTIRLFDGTLLNILKLPPDEINDVFAMLEKHNRWSDILRLRQEMIYAPRNYTVLGGAFLRSTAAAETEATRVYTEVKSDKRGHAFLMHLPSEKKITASHINDALKAEDLAGDDETERQKVHIKLRSLYGMSPSTRERGHFAERSGGFLGKFAASLATLYIKERLTLAAKKEKVEDRHNELKRLFPSAYIKFSGGSKSVTKEMAKGERFLIMIPYKEIFGSTKLKSVWYSVRRNALPGQIKGSTVKEVRTALSTQVVETTPAEDEAWVFAVVDVGAEDYVITTVYITDDAAFKEELKGRDSKCLEGGGSDSYVLDLSVFKKRVAELRMANTRAQEIAAQLGKRLLDTPSQGLNCLIYSMAMVANVAINPQTAGNVRQALVNAGLADAEGYIESGVQQVQTIAQQLNIANGTFVIHNTYMNIQPAQHIVVGNGNPAYDIIHTINHYNATRV